VAMDDVLATSRFASLMGTRLVERNDGEACVELRVRDEHANTRGIAHGGVVASLADTAAGSAVAYLPSVGGRGVATVALTTSYLAPVRAGDVLRARARRRPAHRHVRGGGDEPRRRRRRHGARHPRGRGARGVAPRALTREGSRTLSRRTQAQARS